jgi:hypothetical protein
MAVLRWDPWGELAALRRDVNQLLGSTPATGRVGSADRRVPHQ